MKRLFLASLVSVVLALAACGDDDKSEETGAGTTPEPAAQVLDVAMSEFRFDPNKLDAKSGKLTINAANEGSAEHELVLLKTKAEASKLPKEGDSVDESSSVGEIPEVAPGESGSHTFDLKPGKYVMVCALPGHYEGGMYGTLTVR